MKRFTIFFILIPLIYSQAYGYVFINSIPMKAQVFIDDKPAGRTPLLIKDKVQGQKKITFKLNFYLDSEMNVAINNDTNFYSFLAPTSLSVNFPDRDNLIVNDKKYKSGFIKNLPQGIYELTPSKDSVSIKRVNPNKSYLYYSLGIGLAGIAAGVTGSVLANNSYNDFKKSKSYSETIKNINSTTFYDNMAVAGYAIGGVSLGFAGYFFIDDMIYNAKNDEIILKDKSAAAADKDIYDRAMDDMSRLNNANALNSFTRLIDQYPDSQFCPISLLRRAALYRDSGNINAAQNDLEKLKNDYPIYEIYDTTLKDLGDIYQIKGNYKAAVNEYHDAAVYSKNYKNYELDYEIIRCKAGIYKNSKNSETRNDLNNSVNQFIANASYPDDLKKKAREFAIQ
jgi:hypothetical protein